MHVFLLRRTPVLAGCAVAAMLMTVALNGCKSKTDAAIEHAKQEGTLIEDVVKIEHKFFTEQRLKGLCVS